MMERESGEGKKQEDQKVENEGWRLPMEGWVWPHKQKSIIINRTINDYVLFAYSFACLAGEKTVLSKFVER